MSRFLDEGIAAVSPRGGHLEESPDSFQNILSFILSNLEPSRAIRNLPEEPRTPPQHYSLPSLSLLPALNPAKEAHRQTELRAPPLCKCPDDWQFLLTPR